MRTIRPGIALLALLPLLAAGAAHAQDTLSTAARLVARQPAGAALRLNVSGRQVTGVIERVTADSIYLASPPNVLPLSGITDAWLQRRATRTGGRVGAWIGAPTGAVVVGLGTWVALALCEYECEDWGAGHVALGALIGAAAGGAAGYLIGSLFGSSVPRWEPLTESSGPAMIIARDPRRAVGLSSLNLTPAIARAAENADGVGGGASVSYLSQLSRHFALGAELGIYDFAAPYTYEYPCGADLCTETLEAGNSWNIGALARFGTGAERRIEPFALLGVGIGDFGPSGVTLGSYTAGGGLRFRPGTGRFAVSGEARWHSNLTNSGNDRELGFYTLGVGLTLLR
ncbi:MAG TPA: hypothetical protein VFZ24_04245 [Longimicrobiales bacterium]